MCSYRRVLNTIFIFTVISKICDEISLEIVSSEILWYHNTMKGRSAGRVFTPCLTLCEKMQWAWRTREACEVNLLRQSLLWRMKERMWVVRKKQSREKLLAISSSLQPKKQETYSELTYLSLVLISNCAWKVLSRQLHTWFEFLN